jgi:hypothetical protein
MVCRQGRWRVCASWSGLTLLGLQLPGHISQFVIENCAQCPIEPHSSNVPIRSSAAWMFSILLA